jgi:hypothetical protein
MTDQNRPDETEEQREKDRREQRMMWIFSGSLFHKDSTAARDNTDISAQSRTAPVQ